MKKKPKVLLLVNELTLTGAPKSGLDIFEKLKEELEIRTVSLRGGPIKSSYQQLGPLAVITDLSQWGKLSYQLKSRLQKFLWSFVLLQWRPDLIYVNSAVALRIAKILRLPRANVLLHVRELHSLLREHVQDSPELLLNWPSRYIAASHAVCGMLKDCYHIPEEKITVIHSFVVEDDPWFQPSSHQVLNKSRFVIGGVGGSDWRKGMLLWLQMAVKLKQMIPQKPIQFVWVGAADNSSSMLIKEMACKMGMGGSIEFLGLVENPTNLFSSFDILAFTSLEDACPRVVLECMMLKIPVVCFEGGGGAPEEVGNAGIVVKNFSPELMAQAIADLSQDPEQMRRLGQSAFERVQKNFISSIQVPKIREEIYKLLGKNAE